MNSGWHDPVLNHTKGMQATLRVRNHFVSHKEAWFHGIPASIIPIPQMSVMPAKVRPSPTKPERPINTDAQADSGPLLSGPAIRVRGVSLLGKGAVTSFGGIKCKPHVQRQSVTEQISEPSHIVVRCTGANLRRKAPRCDSTLGVLLSRCREVRTAGVIGDVRRPLHWEVHRPLPARRP